MEDWEEKKKRRGVGVGVSPRRRRRRGREDREVRTVVLSTDGSDVGARGWCCMVSSRLLKEREGEGTSERGGERGSKGRPDHQAGAVVVVWPRSS